MVKLMFKWTGPFFIIKVFSHGSVELENTEGAMFTVNGQRKKIYMGLRRVSMKLLRIIILMKS